LKDVGLIRRSAAVGAECDHDQNHDDSNQGVIDKKLDKQEDQVGTAAHSAAPTVPSASAEPFAATGSGECECRREENDSQE
jgi:hypothetical protein